MVQIQNLTAQVYQIDSYRYFLETEKGNLIYSKLDNVLKSVELSLTEYVESTGERVAGGCSLKIKDLAPSPIYSMSSIFLQRIMS